MKQNFIVTADADTRNKLIKLGLTEVNNSNGLFTFVNSGIMKFSDDIDQTKIKYSNTLCC